MAIYRSDQAQVTFQTEINAGAYVELATGKTDGTGTAAINGAHTAGAKTLTVDAVSGITAGEFIQIGAALANHAEVREAVHVTATSILLNAPTAFPHADNDTIQVVTGVNEVSADQYINLIPGVYETVDTPDPEMAIEGRYFLGTASKRNYFAAYSGQQTYSGSIGGFVLLNGKSLRYPIGKVNTTTTYLNTAGGTSPTHGGLLSADAKKGDILVNIDNMLAPLTQNGFLVFTGSTSPATTSTATTEVRKYISTTQGGASQTNARLDYPLQFDHDDNEYVYMVMTAASGSTIALSTEPTHVIPYTHAISETVDLDSVTWHVHMLPSDEDATKAFDRRYFGGKIGSMTISAEEGGMVTAGWDSVNFLGMVHNQNAALLSSEFSSAINGALNNSATVVTLDTIVGLAVGDLLIIDSEIVRVTSIDITNAVVSIERAVRGSTAAAHLDNAVVTKAQPVPFYSPMQSITSGEVEFPTTEPYYFSQGEVSLFGQTIAKVRSFSLSISNNEEPRYYISKQLGRRRGPTEIKEQRREYSCAVTLALPDAAAANTAQRTLWNELLLEGNYGGTNFNRTGKTGFDITFTLTRGEIDTNTGSTDDKITITIPSSSAATGGNSQGALIRTAPHNITEDNPFQVEADILFRSMKIDIQDAEHYYP